MSDLIIATDPEWNAEKHGKSLCDRFGRVLAFTYPGYRWRIDAQPHQGIVDVRCEHASCYAGYTFNLRKNGIPDDAAIARAGGEVLERYGLGRRGFSEDQYRAMPRWCGQLRPEW
jgi:hypothetical protein